MEKKKKKKEPEVNSGATEVLADPAPLVTSVVLLVNDTNIFRCGNHVGYKHNVYVNQYNIQLT